MPDKPSELEPCPFCGAEQPKPHIWYGNGGTHECDSCHAFGPTASDVGKTMAENLPHVVAAWNRRTPDRAALVAVAKLAWEEGIDAPGSASDATAERIVDKYLAEQAGKDDE